MFYPRLILPQLEQELTTKEATVITGMRQVGKTTLLKHLLSLVESNNKVLLDLENPLYRKIFEEENYDTIWNNLAAFGITNTHKAYIFLDEVQKLPDISKAVKYLFDHWDIKFVLTGSSSFYLKNLFPESMAGRKVVFEVFPLTFAEFLKFKEVERGEIPVFTQKAVAKNRINHARLIPYYQEFLEFGGFPRIVLEQDPQRKQSLLLEIFKSYFELDVKSLAEFISLLSKFSGSIDRQAAGSQKLFLCDTGMANALGKISEGQAFEQSIFQTLHPFHQLNYFAKNSTTEIDFIVDGNLALEVKCSVSRRDIAHLKARTSNLGLAEQYVVTKEYSSEKETILSTDL